MINSTKTITYDNRARLFWIMAIISVLSLFVYVYGINATARSIVIRQDLEKQVNTVSTDLDSLEFTYIKLKNDITMDLAYHYGLKEVKNPLYISRTNRASLSFNTLR